MISGVSRTFTVPASFQVPVEVYKSQESFDGSEPEQEHIDPVWISRLRTTHEGYMILNSSQEVSGLRSAEYFWVRKGEMEVPAGPVYYHFNAFRLFVSSYE